MSRFRIFALDRHRAAAGRLAAMGRDVSLARSKPYTKSNPGSILPHSAAPPRSTHLANSPAAIVLGLSRR